MSCRDFEGLLDELLEGALSDAELARCVDHAAACRSCRQLVEPMGVTLAAVGTEPPPSLLPAVLSLTSHAVPRRPWAETWRRWMLRPRFAYEAAYIGVVILSLAHVTVDSRAVFDDLRSEAGILLDRAASLWEKEKP